MMQDPVPTLKEVLKELKKITKLLTKQEKCK